MSFLRSFFQAYREAYSGLPRSIWLLSLIMLINRSGTMALVFFVLYLTNRFGFSDQIAGAIISVSAVGGILGALIGGELSDRFGSIRTQVFFLVLVSLQFFLMPLATSLTAVCLMLYVLMFFNEAVRPGLHAACLEYCEVHQQKRSMGLMRLAVNLGMAIGPLIGGFLAEGERWNLLFWIDGATCLVAAGLLAFIFGLNRPLPEPSESKSQATGQSPWRDRRMLQFGVCYLLVLLVFIQIASTMIIYMEEIYGLSESRIGMVTAINPILIVLIEMVVIRYLEHRSAIRIVAYGSLLICVGFGIMPFGTSVGFCILTVIVWTMGEILAFPISAAYVAELSTDENRGQYMSFITVLWSTAMIIGPFIGLTLYTIHPDLPWYCSLCVGAVVFPMMLSLGGVPAEGAEPSLEPVKSS